MSDKNPSDDASGKGKDIPSNPTRVIVESFPPKPTPSQEYDAEKTLEKRLRIGMAVVELFAFAALVIYVCETRRTNNLTQQALNDERLHFAQTQRPWVGMTGDFTLSDAQEANWPILKMGYRLKNFGASPAMNVVAPIGPIIADVNNYSLVKSKVEVACKSGENLVALTGDLLLPGGDKGDTFQVGKKDLPDKFIMPGCIVYRDSGGKIHHTQLCYVVDSPTSKTARTCWFQSAD